MKIALLGYGKMGKTIEKIALERGHEICLKIDSKNQENLTDNSLQNADAAIEFSTPNTVINNIEKCFKNRLPVVVGTTGWYDEWNRIKQLCYDQKGTLLTATNFSVGVNLFFELNKKLTQIMASNSDYKAEITEIHHTEKLDSPSGTAISIAEDLIENHPNYNNWVNEASENKNSLFIHSIREEDVKGTHLVKYESEIDLISIEHFAKNRNGFALGAVLSAEYIHQKTGIFTMKDVLNL